VISRWRKGGARGTVESSARETMTRSRGRAFSEKFWEDFQGKGEENATFARLEFHSVMLFFFPREMLDLNVKNLI